MVPYFIEKSLHYLSSLHFWMEPSQPRQPNFVPATHHLALFPSFSSLLHNHSKSELFWAGSFWFSLLLIHIPSILEAHNLPRLSHAWIFLSISWVPACLQVRGTFNGTLIQHTSRFEEQLRRRVLKKDGKEFVVHAPYLLVHEQQSHFLPFSSEDCAYKYCVPFSASRIPTSLFHGQGGIS